jgi:pimeloyl-ACP methyl ester carboxylesterase
MISRFNWRMSGRALKYVRLAAGILFCVLLVSTLIGLQSKIDRAELGIGDKLSENCERMPIKSFWTLFPEGNVQPKFPDYNAELVAYEFGIYAAFSANAYEYPSAVTFKIAPGVFGWEPLGEPHDEFGSFSARAFTRADPKFLDVMVVFRGTDGPFALVDHVSNASYVTQMLNPWDQYRTARRIFSQVRDEAKKAAGERKIRYLAVGHSLGGGLARHVAAAFPCLSAITFNSSFVSNEYRLAKPYADDPACADDSDRPQVVDIFEDDDPLSRAKMALNPGGFYKVNRFHQWYRMRDVAPDAPQHSIAEAAVAMARIPLECVITRSDCQIADDVQLVRRLRCEAYQPNGRSTSDELCRSKAAKMVISPESDSR